MVANFFLYTRVKGDQSVRNNYRDLTITDTSCKPITSTFRERLAPSLNSHTIGSQYGGGSHGGSTAIAHLFARSQVEHASCLNLSCIQIYIDVVTAFASMVRSLAVPLDSSDAVLFEKLRTVGFTDTDIKDIMHNIVHNTHVLYNDTNSHFVHILSHIVQSTCNPLNI